MTLAVLPPPRRSGWAVPLWGMATKQDWPINLRSKYILWKIKVVKRINTNVQLNQRKRSKNKMENRRKNRKMYRELRQDSLLLATNMNPYSTAQDTVLNCMLPDIEIEELNCLYTPDTGAGITKFLYQEDIDREKRRRRNRKDKEKQAKDNTTPKVEKDHTDNPTPHKKEREKETKRKKQDIGIATFY